MSGRVKVHVRWIDGETGKALNAWESAWTRHDDAGDTIARIAKVAQHPSVIVQIALQGLDAPRPFDAGATA